MAETLKVEYDTEVELAGKIESFYKEDERAKQRFERQLYLNCNFVDGHHFLWWRKASRTIDRVTPPTGIVLRAIPKAARQVEAIATMMTATPVSPVVSGNLSADEALGTSQWLQNLSYDLKLKTTLAELVWTALHQTYALLEIGYDPEEDEIWVDLRDAFDILLPPNITSLKETPRLFKIVPKRISELEESEVYSGKDNPYRENIKDLKPEGKWAASDVKDMLQTEEFGLTPGGEEETDVVVLKECYLREKQKDGRPKIRIITLCQGSILRNELTEYEKFPFVLLKLKPGHIYKPAWIQRFMSSNKSLDMIVSQVENFARLFWVGKIFKRKGQNVTRLTNEQGAVFEFDGVAPPEIKDLPNLPPSIFVHITNLERWIEEQGVSALQMSRLPRGLRAAKMMESMKQSDYDQLSMPMLFYSATLERLYEKIIDCAAINLTNEKEVSFKTEESERKFKVVGEAGYTEGISSEEEKPVVLKADYKVRIDLEPSFAYTAEGRRTTLSDLIKLGLPMQEALLKELKVSNIGDILRKIDMQKKQSMIDAPDFQILPDEIKQAILNYLKTPQAQGQNPLAFADQQMPEKTKVGG